jgi:hypothetical protein
MKDTPMQQQNTLTFRWAIDFEQFYVVLFQNIYRLSVVEKLWGFRGQLRLEG